ncbi:MAG: recombinase family protein [Rhodospirillaceae bacterium]|nr:recombinase family protein [Rhodospirillaceae bacterium]
MSKIGSDHLAREAVVYIRQSTPDQLRNNHESRRRQYDLADRARGLGWDEPVVIDDDLGRSGGGTLRPGFERLLLAVCEGRVGIVLSLEASRLARNGREWHTLLEFCGLVGCLLGDEDGLYDPRLPNDRLLLGMKGTLSEMELSTLRQRSLEALRLKASRGELFLTVAVGYVKVGRDRIAKDPDERVREAIDLVFRKFAEFRSIRQVHLWLRQEDVLLPTVKVSGEERRIAWKPPVYGTVHKLLTNPVYAGAYAFGRTESRVTVENGRKRVTRGFRRDRADWDVLIPGHHEGYVPWEEFERNQRLIADNANCRGLMARGAVRRGDALLAGLLRCGHCGRRVHVHYSGTKGYCVRYGCRGAHLNHGTRPCIAFGGLRVDTAVGDAVLRLVSPLGVEAALAAIDMRESDQAETQRQAELALTQARYEADLARRQYDAVDPGNRLVAAELERRWNDRLAEVRRQEERLAALAAERPEALSHGEKERLMALGEDLATAWTHPDATAETRKGILRAVLEEIVVTLTDGRIDLLLHWRGGDHTRLSVPRNRTGQHRWAASAEVVDLVRGLARQLPDGAIAATLNRLGKKTGRGNSWTEARVRSFRNGHDVAVYRSGEMAERGELTLTDAAERLGISKMTVLRLISDGTIEATQVCKGAPWAIPEAPVDALCGTDLHNTGPRTPDPNQEQLELQ